MMASKLLLLFGIFTTIKSSSFPDCTGVGDYGGHDMAVTDADRLANGGSLEDCASYCHGLDGCEGYTFSVHHVRCFPKTSYNAAALNPWMAGITSGPKDCYPSSESECTATLLTDLSPASNEALYYMENTLPQQVDPFAVQLGDGATYSNYLYIHPSPFSDPKYVGYGQYSLGGAYSKLTGTIGVAQTGMNCQIDPSSSSYDGFTVKIIVDGVTKYTSGTFTPAVTTVDNIDIDVTGGNTLRIEVDGNEVVGCDYFIFANPAIQQCQSASEHINPTYSGVYRTHPYATPFANAQDWCQNKYGTDLATIRNMNDQQAARTGCTAWKCIVSLEYDYDEGNWFNPEGTSFEAGYTPEFISGQGSGAVGKYAYIYGPIALSYQFEEINENMAGYPLCNHPNYVPAKSVNMLSLIDEDGALNVSKPLPMMMIIIGGLLIVNLICFMVLIYKNCFNKKNNKYAKVRNYATSDEEV